MEKRRGRYFPDELKRQAAERVETSGLSVMDVAAELGVHETQLHCWQRQVGLGRWLHGLRELVQRIGDLVVRG